MDLEDLHDLFYDAYWFMNNKRPAHARLCLLRAKRMLELAKGFHPDIDDMLFWTNGVLYDLQHKWWSHDWRVEARNDLENLIKRAAAWCDCRNVA